MSAQVLVPMCCASLLALATLSGCGQESGAAPAGATTSPPATHATGTPAGNPAGGTGAAAANAPANAAAPATTAAPGATASAAGRSLLEPKGTALTQTAPETYKAKFVTTQGEFVVEVHRAWAPQGADRFYNLVGNGYYDGVRFFRVVAGFMAQFGIHGDPKVAAAWRTAAIPDDPVASSNKRGNITFAMAGPGTRTTQLFINLVDNERLDSMRFAPFGQVVSGMDVVDKLYSGYGDAPPQGQGPDQGRMQMEGNTYLDASFPKLDAIKTASIVKE